MSVLMHPRGGNDARARRIATPFVLAAAVGAGALAVPTTALASPRASVHSHVRRADTTVRTVLSAAANGHVQVALDNLTAQLDAAASVSAQLAVSADTQAAEQTAGSALTLVAGED